MLIYRINFSAAKNSSSFPQCGGRLCHVKLFIAHLDGLV